MSFTLLSIVILAITAAFVYRHVRLGYKRGLTKTLISLAILIFSALIATVLSSVLSSLMTDGVVVLLKTAELYEKLIEPMGGYVSVIMIVIKTVISLIIYIPVFFILRLVVAFIFRIVCTIVIRKKGGRIPQYLSENEDIYVKKEKNIGAAIGALSGVILSIIIFMPLIGGMKSVNNTVGIVGAITGKDKTEQVEALQMLDKYSNDFMGTVFDACGGGMLYDLTTRISYSGEVSCINNELEMIESIDTKALLASFKNPEVSATKKLTGIEPVLDAVNDTVVVKMVFVEFIKNASSTWLQHGEYMGIPRPSLGNHRAMEELLDSVLLVCSTTTFDTYDADVRTFMNIAKIVSENEKSFNESDYSTFIDTVVRSNLLQRIEDELDKNPHMANIKYAINDMIMCTIVTELDATEKYPESVKKELYKALANALTDTMSLSGSTKTVTLANQIVEDFKARGINIPDQISARVALAMSEGVAVKEGKITDKEVEIYLNSFRD